MSLSGGPLLLLVVSVLLDMDDYPGPLFYYRLQNAGMYVTFIISSFISSAKIYTRAKINVLTNCLVILGYSI